MSNVEQVLIEQFKQRVFDESYPRIFKCLDRLTEEQVWKSPGARTNSIGNLVLHLEGNARQWVLATLFDQGDHRDRASEFGNDRRCSKEELVQLLHTLKEDIDQALKETPSPDLDKKRKVQIYVESGSSILVHVIEHFSYHTGQIALITKLYTGQDLAFFNDDVL